MIIYGLSNEVWSLESKLELFKKQFDIKNAEMDKVNDKVSEAMRSSGSFYKTIRIVNIIRVNLCNKQL